MRARIELQGALTYSRGGKIYKRGRPVITGDTVEIAFAKATSGFHVVMLGQPPKTKAKVEAKVAPAAPSPKPKAKAEAPPAEASKSVAEEATPPAKASRPKRPSSKAKSAREE